MAWLTLLIVAAVFTSTNAVTTPSITTPAPTTSTVAATTSALYFVTKTVAESSKVQGQNTTLTFMLRPSTRIYGVSSISITGLSGTQTQDNGALPVTGLDAGLFGRTAAWTNAGTLILTLGANFSISNATNTAFSIVLLNRAVTQTAVTPQVSASGNVTIAATDMVGSVLSASWGTFVNASISETNTVQGAFNTLTLDIIPSIPLAGGTVIAVSGLTGSMTPSQTWVYVDGPAFTPSAWWAAGTIFLRIADGQWLADANGFHPTTTAAPTTSTSAATTSTSGATTSTSEATTSTSGATTSTSQATTSTATTTTTPIPTTTVPPTTLIPLNRSQVRFTLINPLAAQPTANVSAGATGPTNVGVRAVEGSVFGASIAANLNWTTAVVNETSTTQGGANTLTFVFRPQASVPAGSHVIIGNLTGTGTHPTIYDPFVIAGPSAGLFSAKAFYNSLGQMYLTVGAGKTVSSTTDCIVSVVFTNPAWPQTAVLPWIAALGDIPLGKFYFNRTVLGATSVLPRVPPPAPTGATLKCAPKTIVTLGDQAANVALDTSTLTAANPSAPQATAPVKLKLSSSGGNTITLSSVGGAASVTIGKGQPSVIDVSVYEDSTGQRFAEVKASAAGTAQATALKNSLGLASPVQESCGGASVVAGYASCPPGEYLNATSGACSNTPPPTTGTGTTTPAQTTSTTTPAPTTSTTSETTTSL